MDDIYNRDRKAMDVIRAAVQAAPENGGVAFVLGVAAMAYEIVDTMLGGRAAADERVKQARLEGAREAWRIARNNAGATQFGDVDFSDARIIYRATFGEEASE